MVHVDLWPLSIRRTSLAFALASLTALSLGCTARTGVGTNDTSHRAQHFAAGGERVPADTIAPSSTLRDDPAASGRPTVTLPPPEPAPVNTQLPPSTEPSQGVPGTAAQPAEPTGGQGVPSSSPRFVVVPMQLVPTPEARGPDARIDLELRANGAFYSHGRFVGQLVDDRVLDASGREILSVASDGTVSLGGTPTHIRLLETGEVTMPNRATLSFSEDGIPMVAAPGQVPRQGHLRLMGLLPEARRTAGLMAIIVATVSLP